MLVEDISTSMRKTFNYILDSVIDDSIHSQTEQKGAMKQTEIDQDGPRSNSLFQSKDEPLKTDVRLTEAFGMSGSLTRVQEQYKHMLGSILSSCGNENIKDSNDYKNVIAEVYTEEDDMSGTDNYRLKQTAKQADSYSRNQFQFNNGIRSDNDTYYDEESQSLASGDHDLIFQKGSRDVSD